MNQPTLIEIKDSKTLLLFRVLLNLGLIDGQVSNIIPSYQITIQRPFLMMDDRISNQLTLASIGQLEIYIKEYETRMKLEYRDESRD